MLEIITRLSEYSGYFIPFEIILHWFNENTSFIFKISFDEIVCSQAIAYSTLSNKSFKTGIYNRKSV